MQPDFPPRPPDNNRGIRLPLLVNGGLMLVLALLAYAGNGGRKEEAMVFLALALGVLVLLNGVALLVAAFTARGYWAAGFGLSIGLLLLIGLGTCGLLATT